MDIAETSWVITEKLNSKQLQCLAILCKFAGLRGVNNSLHYVTTTDNCYFGGAPSSRCGIQMGIHQKDIVLTYQEVMEALEEKIRKSIKE